MDGNNGVLDNITLGGVSAADRNNLTGFLHQSESGLVPVGTRTARIEVYSVWTQGGFNDGYVDNVSLVFRAPGTLYLPTILR